MKTAASLNFVNVKKDSGAEDFENYSFMVQDVAAILVSLGLEAVIVEVYGYSGTKEEKTDVIRRICTAFSDSGDKKFVICAKACVSMEEFPESEYYDPGDVCSEACAGRKPVPFDEVIARESAMLESIGFVDFNCVVVYETSKAYVYANDLGKRLLDYSSNYQDS